MLVLVVLMELSVVQRLGLSRPEPSCGSVTPTPTKFSSSSRVTVVPRLWLASLATFFFGVLLGQSLYNACIVCMDCDHELPASFGFTLSVFKMVETHVELHDELW